MDRHKFLIDATADWTGYQCECVLRKYGIKIKDRRIVTVENEHVRPHLSFTVKRDQAAWAEYLLFRAGVPVISNTLNPDNEQHRQAPRSLPPGGGGARRLDFTTRLIDIVTPLFGCRVGDFYHPLPTEKRQRRKKNTARQSGIDETSLFDLIFRRF